MKDMVITRKVFIMRQRYCDSGCLHVFTVADRFNAATDSSPEPEVNL